MRSREQFTLEPSKREQELKEKLKNNPKSYIEDQLRSEMERRLEGMKAHDLVKFQEKGTPARTNMIETFLESYNVAIGKLEKMTKEKIDKSFHIPSQKPVFIGDLLDKVIVKMKQDEQLASDQEKEKRAKMHRGSRDNAPDTLHYGD